MGEAKALFPDFFPGGQAGPQLWANAILGALNLNCNTTPGGHPHQYCWRENGISNRVGQRRRLIIDDHGSGAPARFPRSPDQSALSHQADAR
jgi:hypothetical protein